MKINKLLGRLFLPKQGDLPAVFQAMHLSFSFRRQIPWETRPIGREHFLVLIGITMGIVVSLMLVSPSFGMQDGNVQVQTSERQNRLYAQRVLIRGLTFIRTGFPDKAVATFEEGLKVLPNDHTLLSAMAEGQRAMGDITLATFYINKALLSTPTNPDYVQQAFLLAVQAGDVTSAMQHTETLIGMRPQHPETIRQHLNLLSSTGAVKAARDFAHAQLSTSQLDNSFLEEGLLRDFLDSFVTMGDLDSALDTAHRISARSGLLSDQFRLSSLYIQAGDNDGALRELLDILEDEPNHQQSLQALQGLQSSFPDRDFSGWLEHNESESVANEGVELAMLLQRLEANRSDAETAEKIGEIYAGEERWQEAAELASTQVLHDPRQISMWQLSMVARMQMGEIENAVRIAEEAGTLFPGYAPLMATRAEVLIGNGEYSAASGLVLQALDRVGNSPELIDRLNQLLTQLEQYQ